MRVIRSQRLETLCALLALLLPSLPVRTQDTDWHPLLHTAGNAIGAIAAGDFRPRLIGQQYHPASGECELYRVGFVQDLYFQYVQYKLVMPEMTEFTLCFWSKFTNHSNDHPLFSYAVEGQPKAMYSWVSNTDRSSYYSLSVDGHTFYRLNYPLRLNKWYHTCQSWNGKTGEWQLWVNAERVGRGFHNRLVGHVIPGGGVPISGQDQTQLGGGFQEGDAAPKGAGGMLGELTLLQLYRVALTAGKAHRDHKHHHAHRYDHDGTEITTPPPPPAAARATPPAHPLITGGQLNPSAAFNIAGQQFQAQYVNGQFASGLVSQQLAPRPADELASLSQQSFILGGRPLLTSGLVNHQSAAHNLFKRELVLAGGHLIDDSLLADGSPTQSLLAGLAGISANEPVLQQQMRAEEREPAEAEVKAVMALCSGCAPEPFAKALVLAWRSVGKKLYSGTEYSLIHMDCAPV